MAKKAGKKTRKSSVDGNRYRKVEPRMWRDAKFRRLSRAQPNAQTLWNYLLTAPEGLMIPGVIPAGEMALAEALGWTIEQFRERFAELVREGMAESDWDARLVWIPKAIHNNPPANQNTIVGWSKAWPEIPECDLKDRISLAIKSFIRLKVPHLEVKMQKEYSKGLDICFPNRYANRSANGTSNQEQEQEAVAGVLKDNPPSPLSGEDLRQLELERARLLRAIDGLLAAAIFPELDSDLRQHRSGVEASVSLVEVCSWSPAPLCPNDGRFDEFFRIVEESKAWAAEQGSRLHRYAA